MLKCSWSLNVKKLVEVMLAAVQYNFLPLSVLLDKDFTISFNADLKQVLSNLTSLNYKLVDFNKNDNDVTLHGLLVVDIIQFIELMKNVNCIHNTVWKLPLGINENNGHYIITK